MEFTLDSVDVVNREKNIFFDCIVHKHIIQAFTGGQAQNRVKSLVSVLFLNEFSNILDQKGLYKDAEIIDSFVREAVQKRVRPNYKNILIALSPLVATMLMSHLHHAQPPAHVAAPPKTVKPPPPLPRGNVSEFVDFLDQEEGGISNRKRKFDPGGLTNRGITQRTYNEYRRHNKLPKKSVKKITDEEREAIIKKRYWNPLKADYLPSATAKVIADWKFNGGFSPKVLQKLIGVPVTGEMDKATVMGVWHYTQNDPKKDQDLAHKLISARQKYLESLKTHKRHKTIPLINYNRGWYNRLNDLKKNVDQS